ncbi:MAG TPA: hypothetical protein VKR79_02725 [Gaiellaceae bacterium]|nr:hypothetical protein [Gaiellaceae bacterium]
MSIGDWFKRIFSSSGGTSREGTESIDEVRIDAGGGADRLGADYAGLEAEEAAEADAEPE